MKDKEIKKENREAHWDIRREKIEADREFKHRKLDIKQQEKEGKRLKEDHEKEAVRIKKAAEERLLRELTPGTKETIQKYEQFYQSAQTEKAKVLCKIGIIIEDVLEGIKNAGVIKRETRTRVDGYDYSPKIQLPYVIGWSFKKGGREVELEIANMPRELKSSELNKISL